LHSGRTIDAIRMNGWRNDIGYPEDRDEAEQRLRGESETDNEDTDADVASVPSSE